MSSQNHNSGNGFYRRRSKAIALLALAVGLQKECAAVDLTSLISGINEPVGVGYHDAINAADRFLVVTANRDTPNSVKFVKVFPDGYTYSYAYYSGTADWVKEISVGAELKLATIRNIRNNSITAGGFTLGDTFCGTGINGQIMRIYADGSVLKDVVNNRPLPFATLPGATAAVRGITHDRDNVLQGCLVALTADGKVWKVNSAGGTVGAGPLATVSGGQQIEACVVVPNNSARYGILAGKILVGRDNIDQQTQEVQQGLWSVAPNSGAVQQLFVDGNGTINTAGGSLIAAEDLDQIDSAERLHVANWSNRGLFGDHGDPAQFTPGMDGDILITQEGETTEGTPNFIRLQAASGQLTLTALGATGASVLEHVTFAPMTVVPVITISAIVASTAEGGPTPGQIAIHRSAPGPELTIPIKVTGAATFDVDYLASYGTGQAMGTIAGNIRSVVMPDDQTDLTITLSAYDDSRQESIESAIFTLQADTPPAGLLPRFTIPVAPGDKATVTITASDTVAVPAGWKLYDLGVLATGTQSRANGIGPVVNGSATIVGWSRYQSGLTNIRAFTYLATPTGSGPGGTLVDLYPTASWSTANAIDDAGTAAGQFYLASCPRGFRYPVGGPIQQLLTLAADATASSTALVGGSRYTVGTCKAFTDLYMNGTLRATLWKDSGITDLGSLDTAASTAKASYAFGLNRLGRIVGKAQGTTSAFRGFRTTTDQQINPTFDDLGTPLGGTASEATAINDFDEVVGASNNKAVLWLGHGAANSAYVQLYGYGTGVSGSQGINNSGIAVGWRYSTGAGRYVPVLWWNNGGYSLDLQYVESGAPTLANVTTIGGGSWILQSATGINDSHWIVGWGDLTKNGSTQPHAFLLKPN